MKRLMKLVSLLLTMAVLLSLTAAGAAESLSETGVVTDGEGWYLWNDDGTLTVEGRGANGTEVVVASGKYESSKAGIEIIELGGNAVDAAIAVSFALGVVEPNSSGIGGGGFMTLRTGDGDVVFLDFRERAPAAATPELWQLGGDGSVIGSQNMFGGKAVGVPGIVAGMWEAFNKYGSGNVTWAQIIQPAIDLAENGYYVAPTLYSDMSDCYKNMLAYPEFGKIYLNELGLNYQVGDLFKNPELAKTLKKIAEGGKDAFYTGELAEEMVSTINKYGGVFTPDDLANYTVNEYEPVEGTYRGYKIYSSPLPSSGGTHVIQILNIMENFDVASMGFNSFDTLNLMLQAFEMAFSDRSAYMGDPNYVDVPMSGLLSKDYAKAQADQVKLEGRLEYAPVDPWVYEHLDTTHYSVADADGNMVSVTQTVNYYFGSAVSVGGFMLNDEMADFSTDPASPNAIAGGKTPLSSMSPTVVLKEDGSPFLVLGSPGGPMIITTCVQIISDMIDHGMTLQQAIEEPRIAYYFGMVFYENRIASEVVESLGALGYTMLDMGIYGGMTFGSVNAVLYGDDGVLYGGSDPRRDCKALGK